MDLCLCIEAEFKSTWLGNKSVYRTRMAIADGGELVFAMNAGITLHVETLYSDNNHHVAESCFKALARALREAIEIDARQKDRIPSTKGTLAG